jgi:hypothetical protein
MNNMPGQNYAQNIPDFESLPLKNLPPLVEVVECSIENYSGCFNSRESPTTHHQESVGHKNAMALWAIGQGMYAKDAHDLVEREPVKFDEAVFEIINMKAERLEQLNNLGGWIVWFITNKAVGSRRAVRDLPVQQKNKYR